MASNTGTPLDFPRGDISVAVTHSNERLLIKVSSSSLSLASPVWEKFVFPPFGDQNKDVRIDFTEDDFDVLWILLCIAHLRFDGIPTKALPYDKLLQVAVLCDQYDCIQLVNPWLESWLENGVEESLEEGKENWLFIAWVFGRDTIFEELSCNLVRTISLGDDGQCSLHSPLPADIIGNHRIILRCYMTNSLPEKILSIREATIHALLDYPYSFLRQRFSPPRYNGCIYVGLGEPTASQRQCNALVYGSILLELQKYNLYPMVDSKNIHISVNDLAKQIEDIRVIRAGILRGGLYGGEDHNSCAPTDFTEGVDVVFKSIANPVSESHIRHMEAARR